MQKEELKSFVSAAVDRTPPQLTCADSGDHYGAFTLVAHLPLISAAYAAEATAQSKLNQKLNNLAAKIKSF